MIALFFSAILGLHADSQIIPHLADGGGWKTTLVLTNTSVNLVSVKLVFHQETAGGIMAPWYPPFVEVGFTDNLGLAGGATMFLHTTGTSNGTAGAVGWGEVQTTGAVQVYAVFTNTRTTLEGAVPAAFGDGRLLMPFDNTGGRTTAVAIATDASTDQTVAVTIRATNGAVTQGTLGTLPAGGHTSFLLDPLNRQIWGSTLGQEGLIEFTGSVGGLAGIALRYNVSGAFTSAPMYPQSGPPVIK
jgi:hypothetical protein